MEWLVALLPIVLIAGVCLLMMRFMMRGMHGGHSQDAEEGRHVHDTQVRDPKGR